jgi:hypothetical protein
MPVNLPNLSNLRLADPVGAPTYFSRLDEDASKKLDRLLPADAMRKLRSTTRGANYETGTLVILNQTIDAEGKVKDEMYYYDGENYPPEAPSAKWLLAFYRNADGSYQATNEWDDTAEFPFANDGIKVDDAKNVRQRMEFVPMNALFTNVFLFDDSFKAPKLSGLPYIEAWMVLNIPDLGLVGKFKAEKNTRYFCEPWETIMLEGIERKMFDMDIMETITNPSGQKFTVTFTYRVLIEYSMYTNMDRLGDFIEQNEETSMDRYGRDYNPLTVYDSARSDSEFNDDDRQKYGTRTARQEQRNKEAMKSMFDDLKMDGSWMNDLAERPYKAEKVPGEWSLLRVTIDPQQPPSPRRA